MATQSESMDQSPASSTNSLGQSKSATGMMENANKKGTVAIVPIAPVTKDSGTPKKKTVLEKSVVPKTDAPKSPKLTAMKNMKLRNISKENDDKIKTPAKPIKKKKKTKNKAKVLDSM